MITWEKMSKEQSFPFPLETSPDAGAILTNCLENERTISASLASIVVRAAITCLSCIQSATERPVLLEAVLQVRL